MIKINSREIKFRALSIVQPHLWFKYWYYYAERHYGNSTRHIIRTKDGNQYYVDINTLWQFTWLQDKNSVDIYEGDIIKVMENTYMKVEYNTNKVAFVLSGGWYGENNYITNFKMLEVIGNIYQNPELLK